MTSRDTYLKETWVEVLLKRTAGARADDLKDVDAVVLGAPTYHHDLISPMKTFLFKMEKADLKGKVGTAFGSYGWSGESVQMMSDTLRFKQVTIVYCGIRLVLTGSGGLDRIWPL